MAALILVDAGPLVAYYNRGDSWHLATKKFFEAGRRQLLTTQACVTEAMWLLSADVRVQNEFLLDLSKGLYACEALMESDFVRIAELNLQYADLPADFADLSLIAISERLQVPDIASLDSDFDIYRRFGNQRFQRLFP